MTFWEDVGCVGKSTLQQIFTFFHLLIFARLVNGFCNLVVLVYSVGYVVPAGRTNIIGVYT